MADRLRAGVVEAVARLEPAELALRLTLVALLLRPVGDWRFRPGILALAAAGLVVPGWLRRPALWLGLALLAALRVVEDWPLPDNHAYLLVYWCLAIAIALRTADSRRALALNGRLLVGLVFLFAIFWKLVLSPDFLSGDFMRFIWLADDRFADAAHLFGGMDPDTREANRAFLAGAPHAGSALVETGQFVWATRVATWWAAGIETAVAATFLWPGRGGPARGRDLTLLLFCATIYAFAPIAGFAWLLIAMGVAQSDPSARRVRLLYLAAFALVLVYQQVPWLALLTERL